MEPNDAQTCRQIFRRIELASKWELAIVINKTDGKIRDAWVYRKNAA